MTNKKITENSQQLFCKKVFFNTSTPLSKKDKKTDFISTKALQAYQNNSYANAASGLSVTYPTIVQLVGEDFFNYLAKEYHIKNPSCLGDWGEYGADFANEFSLYPDLENFPYLKDIANIDWACHQCERSANKTLGLESLQTLAERDLYTTFFDLAPGLHLTDSIYPAHAIWQAHHTDGDEKDTFLTEAKTALANIESHGANEYNRENYVIWRQQFKALIIPIDPHIAQWIKLIAQGKSIGECLDLSETHHLNFEIWLNEAISHQFVFGIKD